MHGFYKNDPRNYQELLWNINSDNKKTSLANISDRIRKLYDKLAFVIIKDNKEIFINHPQYEVLNPTKNELGIISKKILESACMYARKTLGVD